MRKLLAVLTVMILLPLLVLPATAPESHGKKLKVGKSWEGMASWYGDDWKGRMTACGKPFDPEKLTAAHPYLPCGTWLRITNLRTGHSEFATVTDRGPYEEGREIDVSARVARRIDLKKFGVEKVKIEIVRAE
ncbi:MAG: septal ring lytic transglycosylase RlpA family protein [Candidatus Acidiferrum sp.]